MGLVQFVRPFQIEMFDETARVRARPEMVIQRRVRTPTYRYRFDVAANTSVDEHRLALHCAAIIAREAMFGFALMLMFGLRLHSL